MITFTDKEKTIIEKELFRIADYLLPHINRTAIVQRLEKQVGNNKLTDPTNSLYIFNGSAGIILFYLQLHDYCRQPVYLQACKNAADILLQNAADTPHTFYTLYTGATSLVYLSIKMYEATSEERYIHKALSLALHFQEGIQEQVIQDDLISGNAGNIFVLTHLYAYTGHQQIRRLIKQLTDKMILHTRIAPQGLRWGHIKQSYDCLTGFSHGAAGIAHALMQAAQYFNDEGLQYLATQALAYEMLYYDDETHNWLDLRLTSTRLYETDIMDWQIADFRKYASDSNSWAHGAAGVGLARLSAWQATGREIYAAQVQLAVNRCIEDIQQLKRGDFTLCSGYSGVAAFLLNAAHVLQQPALRQTAEQIALAAVNFYNTHGTYNNYIPVTTPDPGLFSGLAGVGYLLAATLLPYREDAITHPVVPSHVKQHVAAPLYASGEVKGKLFARYYKLTAALLQQSGHLTDPEISAAEDVNALETLLAQKINVLPEKVREKAGDCFRFEQCLTGMWRQHKGLLCYIKRKELLQAAAEKLIKNDDQLLRSILLPCNNVQLCYTQWPWNTADAHAQKGSYYNIIYSHEYGVSIFPAGKLTAIIISSLQKEHTLQETIAGILTTHFSKDNQQAVQAILEQVRLLLKQCFIYSI